MAEVGEKGMAIEEKGINPEEYQTWLQNLQGNILKGHGRKYSRCIFFELNTHAVAKACMYLAQLADKQIITSAWQQHIEGLNFKDYKTPGAMFGNLFLTAKGYQKLGFDLANPEKTQLPYVTDYFLKGMSDQHSVGELKDPTPETWEEGYKAKRIDAMILLADNNEEFLEREAGRFITELREFSKILAYERGNVLEKDGRSVEHFGYADALSQPVLLSADSDRPPEQQDRGRWNRILGSVLVQDTLTEVADCFGSYLVFRKLEQDVIGFEHGKRNLAEELRLKTPKHVGAMMIGRFEDGTPLALSQRAIRSQGSNTPPDNNFTYAHDPQGEKCPLYAHIRATNPRDGTEKQIVRRGIPYGKRASWDRLPTEPVGLLFMCFQADIDKQFVHIQQRANQAHDPIIGQAPDLPDPPQRQVPVHLAPRGSVRGGPVSVSFDTSWVKLRGGEFFFTPSIPFLRDLKNRLPSVMF